MPNKIDEKIAQITISNVYERDGSIGIALNTDIAKIGDDYTQRQYVEALKERVAEKLDFPADGISGIFDGITPAREEIRLRPYSTKTITKDELEKAVTGVIEDAKLRVAKGKSADLGIDLSGVTLASSESTNAGLPLPAESAERIHA